MAHSKRQKLTGTVRVQHTCYDDGHEEEATVLDLGNGETLRLELPTEIQAGEHVSVTGIRQGDSFVADTVAAKESSDVTREIAAPSDPTYNTLVLCVGWLASATAPAVPATDTATALQFLADLDAFTQQQSNGRKRIAGRVAGPFLIPDSTCSPYKVKTQTDPLAFAAGVVFPVGYRGDARVIYLFPHGGCGWSGSTLMGSTYYPPDPWHPNGSTPIPDMIYINGGARTATTAHELGHTWAFGHANTLTFGGPTIGPIAQGVMHDQGNPHSVMGNSAADGSFMLRERLTIQSGGMGSWVGQPDAPVTTVTASGIYTFAPSNEPGSGPRGLVIPAVFDGVPVTFYVEHRRPILRDSTTLSNLLNGVLIELKLTAPYLYGLLDFTPGTGDKPALEVGQTFSYQGVSLEVLSIVNHVTTLRVTLPGGAPVAPVVRGLAVHL